MGERGRPWWRRKWKKQQQQKKQTAVLCPGYTKSPRHFLQKQRFLHTMMGMWAFFLFRMNFSQNWKSLPKTFSFSAVLPLRNAMFMQGKVYFLQKVSLTREMKMVDLELHSCGITLATLRRAEALYSPIICFLWETGKNLNILLKCH